MMCYTGVRNARLYLPRRNKRLAWRAYMGVNDWCYDFSDLRRAYRELFTKWDHPYEWHEEDAFFDDNY